MPWLLIGIVVRGWGAIGRSEGVGLSLGMPAVRGVS